MKMQVLISGSIAACLLVSLPLPAAGQMTTLSARSGSRIRIEGTSSIHDWQAVSPIIGGALQVGKGFPMEPGQEVNPGKVEAAGDVFVMAASLKSVNKDGSLYSD